MKWNCNACGKYVEAGHSCYTPRKEPQTETERLMSLSDSYRRDLDAERKKVAKLQAENRRIRDANTESDKILADGIAKLRAQLKDALRYHAYLEAELAAESKVVLKLQAELDILTQGLTSIANNTCCDPCQEAALVAKAFLDASKG